MVSYFLLRLLPTESTDPQSFVEDLKDLTITAYNLSNSDNFQGVQLGVAKRIPTNYDVDLAITSGSQLQVDTLETSLLPHYQSLNPISSESQDMYITQSAATAVIVINMTPDFEIPAAKSFDIRVILERNSKRIGEATIENSISVTTVDKLPVKQSAYISVLASSTPHDSISPLIPCVFVPPKPKISELDRPFVKLQSNGCNSVEKSGDVEERPLAPARLCAHCMVLTFEARWPDDVTEENNSFNLPYCRQDVYPGLPILKASAENGCEFCGLLREVIESEVPGMRRSANKNLTEEMLSLDLNPKQFNITMDGIRCIVMENNGLLGLDHFYVGVFAVEAVDRDGDKPEDCGGLDMHFDVLAYPGMD